MDDLRTPYAKVHGLGSAKSGTGHFWAQRLTAVALIPLGLWFLISIALHAGDGYDAFVAWLGSPFTAGGLILLIGAGFYHMSLGMQVVIEDYIHREATRVVLLILNKFWAAAAAIVSILAILRVSLAG